MKITVVIADGNAFYRRGMIDFLQERLNILTLAETRNGKDALLAIRRHRPRLAILDADLSEKSGLDILRSLRELGLDTQVILLARHAQADSFHAAVQSGAMGYLLRDSAEQELEAAITSVAVGGRYFSIQLGNPALANWRVPPPLTPDAYHGLTPSERRILSLIARYKTTADIAAELCISKRTVDHHRLHICRKLNLSGKYSLIRYATAQSGAF